MNTFGSVGARSDVTLTRQPRTSWRPRLQDQHDVVGAAGAGAGEHRLHRPRREIAAAAVGRAVHRQQMAAAGLGANAMPLAGHPVDRAFHRRAAPSRDIALQQKSAYTRFERFAKRAVSHGAGFASHRLSPPPPLLVDSAQGSNALGFFLGRARPWRPRRRARMMRRRNRQPRETRQGMATFPPASRAEKAPPPQAGARRLPAEDPDRARLRRRDRVGARRRAARSRPGSATRSASSARTPSRCSASSCAAPTTRWRTSRRRRWRAA